ncbi:putative lipoprotein with Yx(FWY)xxD motif [Bradyrhizobium japonicum]
MHDRRTHDVLDPPRAHARRIARHHPRRLRRAPPTKTGKTDKGNVLTDAKGMTLYTFDKDADGKSACNGPCATNWPVLKAEASDAAGDGYTVITRDDGSRQWAYKGKPLYTFAKDQKPGDITGDGFLNGAWHLAMP